jgi:hypothetical protein
VDADGVGGADLAVSKPGTQEVWIHLGDGAGGFDSAGTRSVEGRQTVAAAGDFDGDGIADEAVDDPLSGGVVFRFGGGAGSGRAPAAPPAGSAFGTALVADLDADGVVDVAYVDGASDRVSVLMGDGRGGFAPADEIPGVAAPGALAAADFDGDGALDLAAGSRRGGVVSVLLGDGSGAFAAASSSAACPGAASLAAGDLDGDGTADLAVACGRGEGVVVLFGDGRGGFGRRRLLPGGSGGRDGGDPSTSGGADTEETAYTGPSVTGLTLSPATITGGSGASSTGTVTLSAPAPAGGTLIALASSNTELAAPVLKIVVPEGAAGATFTVATNPRYRRYSGLAFAATITATNPGNATSRSATLNVTAQPRPTDPVFSPDSDIKGLVCAGETGILFDCPLPSQGTCKFKQECTLGCLTRPIRGASWDDVCATIGPFPVALSPRIVVGGNPTSGTLSFTAPAASGSTASVVSNSLVAQAVVFRIPQTIPAGATSAPFSILTARVNAIQFAFQDAHIRTIESGSSVFTTRHARTWATVVPASGGDVAPPVALATLELTPPSITGGLATFGVVTLDGLAPAPEIGDVTLSMASSDPAVAAILQPSLTVIQGSHSASFSVQTSAVAADTTVTITATLPAGPVTAAGSLSATLTVRATPQATGVRSFFLNPLTVVGGNPVVGTVVLNGVAPPGGAVVTLDNGNPGVVTMPASVTVPAGTDRIDFGIGTSPVAATTNVSLTARYGNAPAFTTLTVTPAGPALTLSSLALSPTSVVGGNSSTGTVTLSGTVPAGSSGAVVTLSSNSSAASVPPSVTVPAGASSATFTVTTTQVTASTMATIAASFGGTTRTASLTVSPPATGTLPAPSLVSPANDARFAPGTTVTFDWTDVAGAASYTIQIDDSDQFTAPLVASQTVTASQVTIAGLPTTRMWWRVRADDASGTPGAWSAVRRFELKN